ncbi:MAG: FKBP-type peptidyl-prolyl cis-trans isomerase [Bacteroidota bacterium]|nr:FKBP-type peptidyl-prolyl cis-trans isomerase [Bacteroidota bacterium]
MKVKVLLALILTIGTIAPSYAQKKKKSKSEPEPVAVAPLLQNKLDSVSYCLGMYFGKGITQSGMGDIRSNVLSTGISDIMTKQKTLIDESKIQEIMNGYMMEIQKAKAAKNLAEGKAFLEKNKADSGVVVLPSGLQYKIIKKGDGPKPVATDKVTVHYHGTLIDGKVFDSSVDRGQPIQLKLDGVIKGWTEALQLMPVGSKWKLFIPSDLAYGENPMPNGPIGPNMALVFDVELISIDVDKPEEVKAETPAEEVKAEPAKADEPVKKQVKKAPVKKAKK